jgi:hypothetical protein
MNKTRRTMRNIKRDEMDYLNSEIQRPRRRNNQDRIDGGIFPFAALAVPALVSFGSMLARAAGPALISGAVSGITKKIFDGSGYELKHKSGREPSLEENLYFLDSYLNKR